MDRTTLIRHCANKKGAEETFPFGQDILVFKVMGKMYALVPLDTPTDQPPSVNLKCDPGLAEILRQNYASVQPGYHMNKKHWNTIYCDDSITEAEIVDWIDHSYQLVVKGLTKKDRQALEALPE